MTMSAISSFCNPNLIGIASLIRSKRHGGNRMFGLRYNYFIFGISVGFYLVGGVIAIIGLSTEPLIYSSIAMVLSGIILLLEEKKQLKNNQNNHAKGETA